MQDYSTVLEGIRQRLIYARKQAGLSQSQVAKLMGYVGTASTVSDWESGKNSLALETVFQLSELYGVSLIWLLTGVNPDFDPSPILMKMQGASAAVQQDLEDLMETLASLRQEPS